MPPTSPPEEKWATLSAKLPIRDSWVQLPAFLLEVGESSVHPRRFLEATEERSGKLWRVGPRQVSARDGIYYMKKGGGGKYHASEAFLERVFL